MPIARKKRSPYFWYDFRYRGRRYRGSTKETSKAAARHFEAQLIAQVEQDEQMPVRGRCAPLLRDLLPQFLTSFNANQLRAEKTKLYYRAGAKLLLATPLSEFPIDRITTSIVAAVRFPHSAYTANNALRMLRRSLGHAVELGYLRTVPKLHLHKESPRKAIFTPAQEAAMLDRLPSLAADVFVICMDTGARPEEVARMKWDDVLWTSNSLRIPEGKTNASAREIGMSARVVETLQRRVRAQAGHKRYDGTPWVFPSSRAKSGHIVGVSKAFREAHISAGLPDDLVLYSARHTFGTEFMEATKNLKLTMAAMGHIDVKTAMRYQHPETGQVSDIMNQRNSKRKSVTTENGHTFGHTEHVV